MEEQQEHRHEFTFEIGRYEYGSPEDYGRECAVLVSDEPIMKLNVPLSSRDDAVRWAADCTRQTTRRYECVTKIVEYDDDEKQCGSVDLFFEYADVSFSDYGDATVNYTIEPDDVVWNEPDPDWYPEPMSASWPPVEDDWDVPLVF